MTNKLYYSVSIAEVLAAWKSRTDKLDATGGRRLFSARLHSIHTELKVRLQLVDEVAVADCGEELLGCLTPDYFA